MYAALTPFEKLIYLSFLGGRSGEDARALAGGPDEGRFGRARSRLGSLGLLAEKGGILESDPAYIARLIEGGSLLYPDMRLEEGAERALEAFLRSRLLKGWMEREFKEAVRLCGRNDEVLASFFWKVLDGPFAVAHAYYLVYGGGPPAYVVGGDFDSFLGRKAGKEDAGTFMKLGKALREEDGRSGIFTRDDPLALDKALWMDFAFRFPRELAGYLRWSVPLSSRMFVAERIFQKLRG